MPNELDLPWKVVVAISNRTSNIDISQKLVFEGYLLGTSFSQKIKWP